MTNLYLRRACIISPSSRSTSGSSPQKKLTGDELVYFTELDSTCHVGLLASVVEGGPERPVGVGRYIVDSKPAKKRTAELGFTVIEEYQGLGIATILLKQLIQIAKAKEISEFTASVLPSNTKMLSVFRNSGLPMKKVLNNADVFEISLSLK